MRHRLSFGFGSETNGRPPDRHLELRVPDGDADEGDERSAERHLHERLGQGHAQVALRTRAIVTSSIATTTLDGRAPEREPALELRLDRELGADLRLEL